MIEDLNNIFINGERKLVVGFVLVVKDYVWGICGMDLCVVCYVLESKMLEEVDLDIFYVEFWIGIYLNGFFKFKMGEDLREIIGEDLFFFFKVLSVGKVLFIQVYLDKEFVECFYLENLKVYGDVNYKFEMVIVLIFFEVMCGF